MRRCVECAAALRHRRQGWCGWCGARLPSPRRRLPATGSAVLLPAAVALAVAVMWLPSSANDPARNGGVGPTSVEVPRVAAAHGPDTTEGPRCRPAACMRWRRGSAGSAAVLVSESMTILIGHQGVEALDARTGREQWAASRPIIAGTDPAAPWRTGHLDDELLAIADPLELYLHEPLTGHALARRSHEVGVPLDLRRHDGVLVVTGQRRSDPADRWRLLGVARDGSTRFRAVVSDVVREPDASRAGDQPLVVIRDEHVERLDPNDGSTLWAVPLAGRQRDGTALLDRGRNQLTVIDPRDGRLQRVITPTAPDEPVAAGVRDSFLVTTSDELVTVYDRDSTELWSRQPIDPVRTVIATSGRAVTMATLRGPAGADEPLVRHRRRGGGSDPLPIVLESLAAPLPPEREPTGVQATKRRDGIVLATTEPASVWSVPWGRQEPALLHAGLESAQSVELAGGLVSVRRGGTLTVHGPDGSVIVAGATHLVSRSPLVAAGPAGVIRLNTRTVDRDGASAHLRQRHGVTRPLR